MDAAVTSKFCTTCDPKSSIPHAIQVTRIRVANLCCSGEEKLIRTSLERFSGIEEISVNVIGRYAVVKHCDVECCAPSAKIMEVLNEKHLGASIQEVGNDKEEECEDDLNYYHLVHVVVVFVMFVIGLVLRLVNHVEHFIVSDWIFIVSVIIGIGPILHSAYIAISRRTVDINILMILAIIGALATEEYFDASLVVSMFIGAEFVESEIMRYVRKAVRMTSGSMSKTAYFPDGTAIKVDDIKVNDILAARAGEMILGDGIVVKGEAVIDESAVTGESIPVSKKTGVNVLSGTVVQNGYIEFKVTVDARNSTLNKLNQAVADVQADKGQYAKLVDQFSLYWTPFVLFAALCFLVIGGGVSTHWDDFLHRALVLLVLACPCAIVIAAPIPAVCAIATAAKHGVLIRGSTVIENMGIINTIALDKTGTLTKGFFKVDSILSVSDNKPILFQQQPNPISSENATEINTDKNSNNNHSNNKDSKEEEDNGEYNPLLLATAIEAKSTHPLANAVISYYCGCIAEMGDVQLPNVKKIQVMDGIGISGYVEIEKDDWRYVIIGNERILKSNGGKVRVRKDQQELITSYMEKVEGKVVLYIAVDDEIQVLLSLSDEIRTESLQFVRTLQQQMYMSVSMLTGDHREVAQNVCRDVGITLPTHCHARLLPNQKFEWIQAQQQQRQQHSNTIFSSLFTNNSSDKSNSSKAKHDRSYELVQTEQQQQQQQQEQQYDIENQTTTTKIPAIVVSLSAPATSSNCSSDNKQETCCGSNVATVATADVKAAVDTKSDNDEADDNNNKTVPTKFEILTHALYKYVLMVGDGINDSTALATATVGVAMGAGGSAMAVAAADVVLMTDNLMLIVSSLKLCRLARNTVIQNCVFAIAIKIVAIGLALFGKLQFWQAILIDLGSLAVVVLNGLKPLRNNMFK